MIVQTHTGNQHLINLPRGERWWVWQLTVDSCKSNFFHVAKSEMNFLSQMPWSYVHIINDDLSAHLWVFASPVPRSWLPLPVTMPLPQTSGSIQFFTFFVVILWWQFKCQTVIPGSWIYIYALKKIKKCWNSFVVCLQASTSFQDSDAGWVIVLHVQCSWCRRCWCTEYTRPDHCPDHTTQR